MVVKALEVVMKYRLALIGVFALVLAACGQSEPPQGQSPNTTTANSPTTTAAQDSGTTNQASVSGSTTTSASNRCTAAVLSGRVETTDAGAGNRYGKLIVTNTNPASCMLNGYSGLQLLSATGQAIPTNPQRVNTPGPTLITLSGGQSAIANLHWTVVPSGNESPTGPCQPEAAKAQAIPPDETAPISLDWGLGPVCDGGKIEISAFYAS